MSKHFELRVRHEAGDVRPRRCEEIVYAEHLVAAVQQLFAKMGSDEPSAASYENSTSA